MAKLYWAKGTCTLASMAALIIAEVPFEAEEVRLRESRANLPRTFAGQRVPVLEHDGTLLAETVAILFWANAHRRGSEPLLPEGEALPPALSRLAWLASRVHPTRRQYARPGQFDPDPEVQRSLSANALPKYRAELGELEQAVRAGEMNTPALACYALVFYHWAKLDGLLGPEHEALHNLAGELTRRPGVREAVSLHGFEA